MVRKPTVAEVIEYGRKYGIKEYVCRKIHKIFNFSNENFSRYWQAHFLAIAKNTFHAEPKVTHNSAKAINFIKLTKMDLEKILSPNGDGNIEREDEDGDLILRSPEEIALILMDLDLAMDGIQIESDFLSIVSPIIEEARRLPNNTENLAAEWKKRRQLRREVANA